MATKRMFSLDVVDTDSFIEMPITARLLYYELGMRADDDGFVDNYRKIMLFSGLKDDDLKVLFAKKFLIPFESGVIVITHWKMNNYIQKDRYKETVYQYEKSLLQLRNNNIYSLETIQCIQNGYKMDTQIRLDKNRLVNNIYSATSNEDDTRVDSLIHYFNDVCKTNYRKDNKKFKTSINLLLKKFTVEDIKEVIKKKAEEWLGTEWEKYLRPQTLFGSKFESYLNSKIIKKPTITMEYGKGSDDFDFNSLK